MANTRLAPVKDYRIFKTRKGLWLASAPVEDKLLSEETVMLQALFSDMSPNDLLYLQNSSYFFWNIIKYFAIACENTGWKPLAFHWLSNEKS